MTDYINKLIYSNDLKYNKKKCKTSFILIYLLNQNKKIKIFHKTLI